MSKATWRCKHCGNSLKPNHDGCCPKCGKTGKHITMVLNETIGISERISGKRIREYYEENPKAKWASILIAVFSPFIGLLLAGVPGTLAGLMLGVISYFLGPKAVMKVREIKELTSSDAIDRLRLSGRTTRTKVPGVGGN